MSYNYYLNTPWWKSRKKAFLLSHPTCERCGSSENLQVHHLRYVDHNGIDVLYRETDDDLATLCSECHHELHRLQDEARAEIEAKKQQLQLELDALSAKYSDKFSDIIARTIAGYFGRNKIKRFPHLAAKINDELKPTIWFNLNTSAYIKKVATLRKLLK